MCTKKCSKSQKILVWLKAIRFSSPKQTGKGKKNRKKTISPNTQLCIRVSKCWVVFFNKETDILKAFKGSHANPKKRKKLYKLRKWSKSNSHNLHIFFWFHTTTQKEARVKTNDPSDLCFHPTTNIQTKRRMVTPFLFFALEPAKSQALANEMSVLASSAYPFPGRHKTISNKRNCRTPTGY